MKDIWENWLSRIHATDGSLTLEEEKALLWSGAITLLITCIGLLILLPPSGRHIMCLAGAGLLGIAFAVVSFLSWSASVIIIIRNITQPPEGEDKS